MRLAAVCCAVPEMERYLCGVIICLLGLGLMGSEGFEVTIKDGSDTCIYANMKVNFTIQYETNANATKLNNVTWVDPAAVNTDGSTCGSSKESPLLVVNFGNNHSWSLNFTKNSTVYSIDVLVFTYNTNDTTLFPDAKRKGLLTTVKSIGEPVPMNQTYTCLHEEVLETDNVVQVYWNVTLLAYAQNVTLKKEFHCNEDIVTTQAPATTTTTSKPTPKPVDKPITGDYSVLNSTGKCLMASMGLQLNVSLLVEGKNVWTLINIDPNNTIGSGSCGNNSALLRLNDSDTTFVEFYFSIKKNNFYLQEVNVTLTNASEISHRTNYNLSLWEASVGKSYLCHKEQLITVSEDLTINTFDVRIQPFGVNNGTFGAAEECFADSDLSFLIPVVVGAVLIFLIILVFISYLIGRRKSRTGYQSV